jgi:hypothetical protein
MGRSKIDPENYVKKNANVIQEWVEPKGKIVQLEAEDDVKRVRILNVISSSPNVQELHVRHYFGNGVKVDKNVAVVMHDRQTIYNMLKGDNPTWSNSKLKDAVDQWMRDHVLRELKKAHQQSSGDVGDLGLPSSINVDEVKT